jgi:XRE family transcriptional regulator, regulator of sulfur utilization
MPAKKNSSPVKKIAAPVAVARTTTASSPKVGEILQRLRTERGLTLDDLSRTAGVSKSMVSDIERDKANPTIAVAWRLTNALGIGLDQLFSQTTAVSEPITILQAHNTPTLANPNDHYQLRICGPMELAGKFEWYELQLSAGGKLQSEGHDPGTMEHLSVSQGSIEVEVHGVVKKIRAGEMARYPADQAHALINRGSSDAKALLVVVHGNVM